MAPGAIDQLTDLTEPGLYAWFVDVAGSRDLTAGIGQQVQEGLIYAGQAGAGQSRATLGSRIRGNHLGSDIYGSTFRLTLASALRSQLLLEAIGGGHMTREGEASLTTWMLAHLVVAVIAYPDRASLETFESLVLGHLDPPLNIAKRPPTPIRTQLAVLRRPFSKRAVAARATEPRATTIAPPLLRADAGLTPEELARELGLADAKRVRGFLRARFPRPASELWSRWGPLPPDMERAVRDRFGGGR